MALIYYRRPPHVTRPDGPINSAMCQRLAEQTADKLIPDELSFDRMLSEDTLPPCQIADFMDYVVFVTHDAENLQFFLWLRDFQKRFESLPESEKKISPVWVQSRKSVGSLNSLTSKKLANLTEKDGSEISQLDETFLTENGAGDETKFDVSPELLHQIQPLRKEVERAIATYLVPNAPRELNISAFERSQVLNALKKTTHPSAFDSIRQIIEPVLRHQSYPNFIRWSICNGNKARVMGIQAIATVMFLMALAGMILFSLTSLNRHYRLVMAPLMHVAVSGIIMAMRGLCMILAIRGVQQAKGWTGWEPEVQDIEKVDLSEKADSEKGLASPVSTFPSPPSTGNPATLEEGLSGAERTRQRFLLQPFGPSNNAITRLYEKFRESKRQDAIRQKKKPFIQKIKEGWNARTQGVHPSAQLIENGTLVKMRWCIVLRSKIEAFLVVSVIGVGIIFLPEWGVI